MSQASTTLTGQDSFLGNTSVVRLVVKLYVALKGEGIVSVEDLEEFDDDDIDNIVQDLDDHIIFGIQWSKLMLEVQRLLKILPQYRLCRIKPWLLNVTELMHGTRNTLLWFVEHYQ